ncbi:Uncharacterised protein [uncultured archaeon]|nr:Uncharacterised protein [uncultured archaeon]
MILKNYKVQKIKKRLEELSKERRQLSEKDIVSPESCILESIRYATYSSALESSYKILCEELNVPYKPLNQEGVKW